MEEEESIRERENAPLGGDKQARINQPIDECLAKWKRIGETSARRRRGFGVDGFLFYFGHYRGGFVFFPLPLGRNTSLRYY